MIIGTAGHIDHGKTTLIQALTGVDTDRLQEEKRRGITIELGFAYLPATDGRVLGFVDVPGHEKFVHTMTAGASGIDHALLVIAADDGIMPQTREHLGILRFMGVSGLTVVLTKIDRVEPERLIQRQTEIQAWLADTPYADAALFPLAAVVGLGVDALRNHLVALPETAVHTLNLGTRYAVDRCFVLAGSGTTVSGLLHSGVIRTGDSLMLSPAGLAVRVRSIHAQNRAVTEAQAGDRCGLVLAGVEKLQVRRGSWLLTPALHEPVERFDAYLQVAQDIPNELHEGLEVMLHHGAARCPARLVLLDSTRLRPSSSGFVQCCLDESLPLFWQDRIVLRDMSGRHTLAGGVVLDVSPPLRGRKKPQRILYLQAMQQSNAVLALSHLLVQSVTPVAAASWSRSMNYPLAVLLNGLHEHLPDLTVLDANGHAWVMTAALKESLYERLHASLRQFHQQQPDEPGLSTERLRRMAFPSLDTHLFHALVKYWLETKLLERSGSFLHAPGHVLTLNEQEQAVWETVLPYLQAASFDPPWVRDLVQLTGIAEVVVRQVLCKQVRRGELHQIVHDLFYTQQHIDRLAALVVELAQPLLSVIEFRDRLQIGRKRTIQILEFFDRIGLTRRMVGSNAQGKRRDERLLRNAQLFSSH